MKDLEPVAATPAIQGAMQFPAQIDWEELRNIMASLKNGEATKKPLTVAARLCWVGGCAIMLVDGQPEMYGATEGATCQEPSTLEECADQFADLDAQVNGKDAPKDVMAASPLAIFGLIKTVIAAIKLLHDLSGQPAKA